MSMFSSWMPDTQGTEMSPFKDQCKQRPMTFDEKNNELRCGFDDGEMSESNCPYFHDLQYQLSRSYYWSDNFMKDYFFFVANWHPFFGMLCSHPYHPWAKKERILTFVVSCSITVIPCALWIKDMTGQGQITGLLGQIAIFICITLPAILIEAALYWLSVGVFQGVKTGFLFVSLFISAIALILSFRTLNGADPILLAMFFIKSRCQIYLIWTPISFSLPCVGFAHCWFMEKNAIESGSE